MKSTQQTRTLATRSMIVGGIVLAALSVVTFLGIKVVFSRPDRNNELMMVFVAIISLSILILPGLSLLYGKRLYSTPSRKNIKGTVGGLSVIVCFFAIAGVTRLLAPDMEGSYTCFLVTLVTLPVYAKISKLLIVNFLGEQPLPGEFIGPGIIGILSFQLWSVLSTFTMKTLESDSLLLTFGPIFVAYAFYYTALRLRPQPRVEASKLSAENS